jgi:hypothetical protein
MCIGVGFASISLLMFLRREPETMSLVLYTTSAVAVAMSGFIYVRRNARKSGADLHKPRAGLKESLLERHPILIGGLSVGPVFLIERWQHGTSFMIWLAMVFGTGVAAAAAGFLVVVWRKGEDRTD